MFLDSGFISARRPDTLGGVVGDICPSSCLSGPCCVEGVKAGLCLHPVLLRDEAGSGHGLVSRQPAAGLCCMAFLDDP